MPADEQIEENAIFTVAVKDINAAKDFYENKLGLTLVGSDAEGVQYKYGNTSLVIYPSPDEAGADEDTSATWRVNGLESVIANLKSKGVTFENYDMQNVTHEGDIHVFEDGVRVAWFTDPDGNIIELDEIK